MHKHGPSSPARPADVTWQTNASLVIASYQKPLSWLETLPLGLVDVVVYNKFDFGTAAPRMSRNYVQRLLKRRILCGDGKVIIPPSAWSELGSRCPATCKCVREQRSELAFFTTLPNYGSSEVKPYGGSREPFVYLQFILDFWHNLPPVVIFSQDDCLYRTCAWAKFAGHLRLKLQHWPSVWDGGAMDATNCFCRLMRESNYVKGKYHWYLYMSFLQTRLLNQTPAARSTQVAWPADANMAVGTAAIRRNPLIFYQILHRLSTVESQCMYGGSILWAHAYERLWFEFFDPTVPKLPRLKSSRARDGTVISGDCLVRWLGEGAESALHAFSGDG